MSDNFNAPENLSPDNRRRPKNLHIAHRRSPSELTNLMVEQYNLQRQLEAVQAQQKQLMETQAQQAQVQQNELMPPPGGIGGGIGGGHSRTSSSGSGYGPSTGTGTGTGSHRRTGSSSNMGHNRRHSLGLNEAIKAAANQRQSNKTSLSPPSASGVSASGVSASGPSASQGSGPENDIGSFKFPPGGGEYDPAESLSPPSSTHGRSRSLAYGQQSFKFPPDKGSLLPPTPNFTISHSPERGQNLGQGHSQNQGHSQGHSQNQNQNHQRRGSHYRTGSRNFDSSNMNNNWRSQQGASPHHRQMSSQLEPPQPFVPGHRSINSSYGGGSSVSSLSHFMPGGGNGGGGNGGPGGNAGGRKSLFAPYLPQSSLPELINDGRLVTGTLRVNKKNRSDAYVSTDGLLDADIFICGSKDRNRALENDFVAVELLVVDEVWESKKEKEEKKRRKDNNYTRSPSTSVLNDDIHNDASTSTSSSSTTTTTTATGTNDGGEDGGLTRKGSLKQRPTMKKNDDVEVEGQSLLLVEEEEINDDVKPLYAGHVVAVVDRIGNQLFAGTLGLLRPAQAAQAAKDKKDGKESSVHTPKAPKIVWFKPTDKKVPLIAIPTEQAPKDFVENHEKYSNDLFVATIKRWPITSLHPFGTLVNKLGQIDDQNTEIDSILRDNNFLCDEYPESEEDAGVLQSLVNELPSIEPELDGKRTQYLTDYIIAFSPNDEFVDHALHVKRLSNTKIELGFHTADVSYFIESGSILDRKAKKRSSSVFLPQKLAHLLPPAVNDIISFKENEHNLAISVVFEIDTTNFEVEDLYIHESVIVPKQVVNYDSVDKILAGESIDLVSSATSDYIKTFNLIAKEFRRQRLNDRTLDIAPNLTLLDQMDDDKVRLDLNIFKDSRIFAIITEVSHKVNSAIAAKIHAGLGDKALLRRHPLPTLLKMETFVRKAKNLGFDIDTTDSSTLQRSILTIDDPINRQCVETLLYKCMTRGRYYVAGKLDPDNYGHYYFNLPLYAHFTAPLRRYADIVVHRQLKSLISESYSYPDKGYDIESLKAVSDYCNFKKDCAANAQEQAIHLLLSQTINASGGDVGHVLCMGTVLQVYESAFDVFIPEFGVEKRVHGDQLPLVKAEFDKAQRVLELYWEFGVDAACYVPPDERTSLSYRNSIKNKSRTSSIQAAKHRSKKLTADPQDISRRLAEMKLGVPGPAVPALAGTDLESDSDDALAPYLRSITTRKESQYNIQEIRELGQVPVLIRAEIGMALPCLTVRILNPFY